MAAATLSKKRTPVNRITDHLPRSPRKAAKQPAKRQPFEMVAPGPYDEGEELLALVAVDTRTGQKNVVFTGAPEKVYAEADLWEVTFGDGIELFIKKVVAMKLV